MGLFKSNQDPIQKLSDYIDKSNKIVAVTGAGISLGGGGVTYGQLTSAVNPGFGFSRRLDSPDFLKNYVNVMFNYKPSLSHYALSDMEREGKLIGIITTNEDCKHTIAGSVNVAEIQGSFQLNRCSKCGKHYDSYEIWYSDELPMCDCGGTILPYELYSHIGLYDEGVRKARLWISQADLIIVIGTNGYYGSAYWNYRNRNAVIVQINPGRTGFDGIADLNIQDESDTVFTKLKEWRNKDGNAR